MARKARSFPIFCVLLSKRPGTTWRRIHPAAFAVPVTVALLATAGAAQPVAIPAPTPPAPGLQLDVPPSDRSDPGEASGAEDSCGASPRRESGRVPETPADPPRVRPRSMRAAELLLEGVQRSPTLQEVVDALQAHDVVVYLAVQPALQNRTGQVQWLTKAGGLRYVQASIAPASSTRAMIGAVAHELQHALEVATAPEVRDAESFTALFKRIGVPVRGNATAWETDGAYETGERARREAATPRPLAPVMRLARPIEWYALYRCRILRTEEPFEVLRIVDPELRRNVAEAHNSLGDISAAGRGYSSHRMAGVRAGGSLLREGGDCLSPALCRHVRKVTLSARALDAPRASPRERYRYSRTQAAACLGSRAGFVGNGRRHDARAV
jgi:hypothetical protein